MGFDALLLWLQLETRGLEALYRQRLAAIERRLGPVHPQVARSASDLGLFLRNLGDHESAAAPLRRALSIDREALKSDDPLLCEDEENLASVLPPKEAIRHYVTAARCGDPGISARAGGKAGDLFAAGGDRDSAVKCYRAALKQEEAASGPQSPRVAVRLNDLVQVLEPDAAEPLARRALAIERTALGSDHPATAVTLNNLANVLAALRRFPEAEKLARESVALLGRTLGRDHPRVATALSTVAGILAARGDLEGARTMYERALKVDELAWGPDHPEVASDLSNLADVLDAMNQKSRAARLRKRAEQITGAKPE